MSITLAGFVLFLHVSVVIASFMIAAVLHTAFHVLPRARSIQEMRPWAAVMHRLEPLLPILAVAILAMGAWLVHLEHGEGARWSDAWVLTPLLTLVVIEAMAGALLAPRTKALCEKVAAAPDGPVPDDVRRMTVNPVVWDIGHIATFGFLGIVFVMTVKPSGGIAWLFPVVGAALGLALSRWQLRMAATVVSAAASGTPTPAATAPAPRGGLESPTDATV